VNVIAPSPLARGNLPAPSYLSIGAGNHLAYLLRQDRVGSTVVQMVSALSGEGTSSLARDLSLIAAKYSPLRVLLVDVGAPGDRQSEWFRRKLDYAPSAQHYIAGLPADIVVRQVGAGALCVSETRGSCQVSAVDWALAVQILRNEFDLLILDSPALAGSFDAVMMAPHVDQNVLVVAAEATRSAVAQNLRDRIQDVGGNIAGTILNKRRFHIPRALYRFI